MKEAEAIQLFKCLADKSRLQILKTLMKEDMYVELLAERLNLTPATISFHLKKLEAAKAVVSHKEQYYTIYSICKKNLQANIIDIISENSDDEEIQLNREIEYRKKIISTFFEYGRLIKIPTQRKKELICLEEIVKSFEIGRKYSEKEVNDIITCIHEDYCTIRRDMIAEKLMKRDGLIYTRIR